MAHIDLGVDEHAHPGILGLVRYRPETGGLLMDLANVLLHADNSLTRGERELIAAYVSGLNECDFCASSHSAFAAAQLTGGKELVNQVRCDGDDAPVSEKMGALLRIAAAVRSDGREVTPELVGAARAAGASDVEIHDTVLIAAAFCMYNRYVDGLGTITPDDARGYDLAAARVVEFGYGS
ncbi:MAG: carboxymuconolactone decarboxylase family protein [Catenulispora sp.]